MTKVFANIGVNRNKKPRQNIVYHVEVRQLPDNNPEYERYKFKEFGWLVLNWKYERSRSFNFHGFITPEQLKSKLSANQWNKFCQGGRTFIVQRRVDGHNI